MFLRPLSTQLDLKAANKRHLEDKKVGTPQLKSKHKSKMSYTTNIHSYKTKDGSVVHTLVLGHEAIKLPKIGWVKIKKHRQPGTGWVLKGATVSCTRSGKYFISLLYEFEKDIQPVIVTKEKSLGLDYSSHDFYVDSNAIIRVKRNLQKSSASCLA